MQVFENNSNFSQKNDVCYIDFMHVSRKHQTV